MIHPARRVYPRSARVGMVARDFPQNPHALSSTNINLIIRRCWLPSPRSSQAARWTMIGWIC